MSNDHLPNCDAQGTMYECDCELEQLLKRAAEMEQRWEAMKADRDTWKARCNEPYDDSVIAENITLNKRVAELEIYGEAVAELCPEKLFNKIEGEFNQRLEESK